MSTASNGGRPPFAPVRPPQRRIEFRAKHREIHHRSKSLLRITRLRQSRVPFIKVEQAPLIRQPPLPR
jgi:hypothetical protein